MERDALLVMMNKGMTVKPWGDLGGILRSPFSLSHLLLSPTESHSGPADSVYTTEIGKCYKPGLSGLTIEPAVNFCQHDHCSALPGAGGECVSQVRKRSIERSHTCSRNQNRKVAGLVLEGDELLTRHF